MAGACDSGVASASRTDALDAVEVTKLGCMEWRSMEAAYTPDEVRRVVGQILASGDTADGMIYQLNRCLGKFVRAGYTLEVGRGLVTQVSG